MTGGCNNAIDMLFECINSIYDLSINIVDLTKEDDKLQIAIRTTGDPSFRPFESFLCLSRHQTLFATFSFDIFRDENSPRVLFWKNYYFTFPFVLMFYSPLHYSCLMLFVKRYSFHISFTKLSKLLSVHKRGLTLKNSLTQNTRHNIPYFVENIVNNILFIWSPRVVVLCVIRSFRQEVYVFANILLIVIADRCKLTWSALLYSSGGYSVQVKVEVPSH